MLRGVGVVLRTVARAAEATRGREGEMRVQGRRVNEVDALTSVARQNVSGRHECAGR